MWRPKPLKSQLFISGSPSSESVLPKHCVQQSVGHIVLLVQMSELGTSQSIVGQILQRVHRRRNLCLLKLKHGSVVSRWVVFNVELPGNCHEIFNPFCSVYSKNCQLRHKGDHGWNAWGMKKHHEKWHQNCKSHLELISATQDLYRSPVWQQTRSPAMSPSESTGITGVYHSLNSSHFASW